MSENTPNIVEVKGKSGATEFGVTKAVKIIIEGGVERIFPLYDMNVLRAGLIFTDVIPPEIPGQIEANCQRVKERLETSKEVLDEPVAIVGYGPTLKRFGQYIPKFKHIISTSGAHKFLLDRDIIPEYHVDVDFRERKAVHTNPSHPDVEYLFSSMVHSAMLDNVEGKRVKLWHIFLKGIKYPDGELVLPGYWDVGQEAILVAKALGYRKMHLFGYDYAYEMDSENTHAGFHNGPPQHMVFAQVGERIYKTSDSLCRGIMTFTALMEDNPDIELTMYSDGLLAAYIKHHYGDEQE